ncbi:MAG: PhoX family phosphatase [Hydrogenophaga sp.]|nr:PhoX family phosphatase [Hydrogenophaga sp.]
MAQSIRDDDSVSNTSGNTSLTELVDRAIAQNPKRRLLLKSGLGMAAIPFLGGLAACGGGDDVVAPTPAPTPAPPVAPVEQMLGFKAVATSSGSEIVVPEGYIASAFAPWGSPINDLAPAWKGDATGTAAEQEQQVGDNHDGMAFFGFNAAGNGFGDRSDEGLLVMNHEYINPEYFYAPEIDATDWMAPFTFEKARKALAAHGISVLHVKRAADGSWEHVKSSPYNRRIHGNTPITIQGPAAGHPLMKTAADPSGTVALGTLNNCGNGRTPWGTYLTCEENFNGYFGWNGTRTATALENRYGISANGFGYRWHTVDSRFDVNATPNEPNRHGYIVEVDPFAPGSQATKRTALGRFKHENAALEVTPSGKVAVYMGCDERNEYVYKFVADGTFDAANPTSAANRSLLGKGTLYVARFGAGTTVGDNMGTGTWIPLKPDTVGVNSVALRDNPNFAAATDAEVLANIMIKTRQAADAVGATMMDRPEWVAVNPKKAGEVFITLTNNNRRGTTTASVNNPDGSTVAGSARPPVDEANPRANNVWGHIVRWNEAGGDGGTATTFDWDIFVLAGQPAVTGARAPSSNINAETLFNSPDGLDFDAFGRMWIQTDGSFANTGDFAGNGNNQMLVADPKTKEIRRFLVGPDGCEVTGITWSPDRKTMFVNIQHPGEVGSHPKAPAAYLALPSAERDNWIAKNPTAFSQWPTSGVRPRSATVVVRRTDGGVIGG